MEVHALGYYASTLARLKQKTKAPPQRKPWLTRHKSPAKQERDRERLEQHQEENREPEDPTVHNYLADEKRLLESTAFRDQREGFKGEVIAQVDSPALDVGGGDVLRDRKRLYVHPNYVRYGFA